MVARKDYVKMVSTDLSGLLEYKLLPADEFNDILAVFQKAGDVVRSHSERVMGTKKKNRAFRRAFFNGDINCTAHSISSDDQNAMNEAHALEQTMLEAYAKRIIKITLRWYSATSDFVSAEDTDFFQACCIAYIDALYGYRGRIKEAAFSTYMWYVLRNRMISFVAENGPLSGLPLEYHLLMGKVEVERNKSAETLTLEDLATRLDVSVEKLQVIEQMVVIYSESQCVNASNGNSSHEDFDYTAGGSPVFVSQATCSDSNRNDMGDFDPLMRRAIKETPLTEFERDVLISSSQQYHGWATAVANRHVNPVTGRKYSRMAPSKQLPSIQEKVKDYYLELSKD